LNVDAAEESSIAICTVSPKLRALIELLRPANVVTALADVLAGYAAAGASWPAALPWLLGSTVCLYGGGIVLNDFFDRELDRVERPERPIPSGRIGAVPAGVLGFLLLAAGIAFAWFASAVAAAVAIAISGSVLLYDTWGKHRKFIGPANMGMCRALNLLLGVSAVPAMLSERWMLALLPLVYIAAVTAISRGEVRGGKREVTALSLGALGLVLAGLVWIGLNSVAALVLVVALAWRVLIPFWRVYREPVPATIRTAVRAGVLSLVLLDAVIGASYSNVLLCLTILTIGVVAALLARAFSVT
jgi:4-hydroxybenzoate polyprenyltransferase